MTVEPDMQLPPGRTCADCAHFRGCAEFIGIKGAETTCDWSPSNFSPRAPTNAGLVD